MIKRFKKMMIVPPWFETWRLATGTIAAMICLMYILTAIRFFQLKKSAL